MIFINADQIPYWRDPQLGKTVEQVGVREVKVKGSADDKDRVTVMGTCLGFFFKQAKVWRGTVVFHPWEGKAYRLPTWVVLKAQTGERVAKTLKPVGQLQVRFNPLHIGKKDCRKNGCNGSMHLYLR